MENRPDHEYQRVNLLRAIRHAQIDASELWLHYFGLGGDAGEYEVEAYLHGSFTLPPLQRDLLAHAANELIDRLPPPPRAPYSTDPAGEDEEPEKAVMPREAAGSPDTTALDWLFDRGPGADTDPDGNESGSGITPP
ncbi:hypothetical protein [Arthrobacter sp. NPDC092385]|uniref:hypothetical protein n=1 Tax=Arthrobacter sp. NPDC092385 TaxID=3363943 RepID=UPI0038220FAF